jgi:hypothetical protein
MRTIWKNLYYINEQLFVPGVKTWRFTPSNHIKSTGKLPLVTNFLLTFNNKTIPFCTKCKLMNE